MKKETLTKKRENRKAPYILTIIISLAVIIVLAVVLLFLASRNHALVAEQNAIKEKYANIARRHNSLTDDDYAEAYFEGRTVHIDNNDLVIKYEG